LNDFKEPQVTGQSALGRKYSGSKDIEQLAGALANKIADAIQNGITDAIENGAGAISSTN